MPSSWSGSSWKFRLRFWPCLIRLTQELWLIYSSSFCNFFSFLLSLFSIFNNNFLRQFTEICDLPVPEMLLHFRCFTHKYWISHRLNDFKLTGMIYCNHSSLMILVSDTKVHYFYSTFQLLRALPHCMYKAFIKSIEFYLFRQNCWLSHLSAI